MTNITKETVKDYVLTGKFDVQASIKPDKESTVSKTVTLRFVAEALSLDSIIQGKLSQAKISYVNTVGRPKYDSIKNASVIEVSLSSPGKRIETPEDKVAKYVAQGYSEAAAKMAVYQPEAFAEIVNKYAAVTE
jgi:hypothetical protein